MSLESGTFISDLITTNPAGGDQKSQGDDHLRLIKTVIKNTFPNGSRAFYFPSSAASQTSTVNVVAADAGKTIPVNADSAAITVNLPLNSSIWDGFEINIVKTDFTTNLITIDGNGSDTINGALTITLWQTYQSCKLTWCSGISQWIAHRQEIAPKGLIIPWTGNFLPEGYLWPNATTIGDASSGAVTRANADTKGLFIHLWGQFADAQCPVSTGRGATALADFNAHKTIALPDMRGRTAVALDNLGGATDAARLNTGANNAGTTGQTMGEGFGQDGVLLTDPAQAPTHSHPSGTLATDTAPAHGHPYRTTTLRGTPENLGILVKKAEINSFPNASDQGGFILIRQGGSNTDPCTGQFSNVVDLTRVNEAAFTGTPSDTRGQQIGGGGSHSHVLSGNTGNNSSGGTVPHSNVQPSFACGYIIKL